MNGRRRVVPIAPMSAHGGVDRRRKVRTPGARAVKLAWWKKFSVPLRHVLEQYAKKNEPVNFVALYRDIMNALRGPLDDTFVLQHYDHLTGLWNRYMFQQLVAQDIKVRMSKAKLADGSYPAYGSLAIVDLNHFKVLNDTHGHRAGDELLRLFAELLKESYREWDILVRPGGDEFIIVARGMSPEDMKLRLEDIRGRKISIPSGGEETYHTFHLDFAIGVIDIGGPDQLEKQMHLADMEMLGTKRREGNRSHPRERRKHFEE